MVNHVFSLPFMGRLDGAKRRTGGETGLPTPLAWRRVVPPHEGEGKASYFVTALGGATATFALPTTSAILAVGLGSLGVAATEP